MDHRYDKSIVRKAHHACHQLRHREDLQGSTTCGECTTKGRDASSFGKYGGTHFEDDLTTIDIGHASVHLDNAVFLSLSLLSGIGDSPFLGVQPRRSLSLFCQAQNSAPSTASVNAIRAIHTYSILRIHIDRTRTFKPPRMEAVTHVEASAVCQMITAQYERR